MNRPESRRKTRQAGLFDPRVDRLEWPALPAEARAVAMALLVELFRETGRRLADVVRDARGTADE